MELRGDRSPRRAYLYAAFHSSRAKETPDGEQTMPAICRADAENPDETLPSRAILDSFLNYLSDNTMG